MKKFYFIFLIIFVSCSTPASYNEEDDTFNEKNYSVNNNYKEIELNQSYKFADFSKINSGKAKLYFANKEIFNGYTVALNAGHGTKGGSKIKTYSHPDKSAKITGGTNPKGNIESISISTGMCFTDGMSESEITKRVCIILKKLLLKSGYNVLMIRESDDVQLDNIARTVISNNNADIHISVHFDGDNLSYDKGCFYCSTPKALDRLPNVKLHRPQSDKLGKNLILGLQDKGLKIYGKGYLDTDLTQTSYSTIPTCTIELGNNKTDYSTKHLEKRAEALLDGINTYFGLK